MRRSVSVLLALGLTLAAACSDGGDGDGGDQGTPAERVAAAADRTREDGTARTTFASTVTGLGGGEEEGSAEGDGLVDFDRSRGSLDVDLGALLGAAGLPGLDAQAETLYEGSVIYLRSDLVNGFLGVDTPWIRIDLDAPGGQGGGPDLGALATLAGNDPGAQLGLLAGIDPDSVEEAGEADVRGEGTSRYRATVDLPSAARNAADEVERQRFERLITQLGTDRVEVEVNLDGPGRVRRIAYSQPLPAGSGSGSAEVELEYYDFGTHVDLTIPAAGEFTDLADVPLPGG